MTGFFTKPLPRNQAFGPQNESCRVASAALGRGETAFEGNWVDVELTHVGFGMDVSFDLILLKEIFYFGLTKRLRIISFLLDFQILVEVDY